MLRSRQTLATASWLCANNTFLDLNTINWKHGPFFWSPWPGAAVWWPTLRISFVHRWQSPVLVMQILSTLYCVTANTRNKHRYSKQRKRRKKRNMHGHVRPQSVFLKKMQINMANIPQGRCHRLLNWTPGSHSFCWLVFLPKYGLWPPGANEY